jgi:hypothetical protein
MPNWGSGVKNDVLVGLGKTRSWQQDFVAAERTYRQVLTEDPDHIDARLGLAETTRWSGKPREAELMYQDILADEPDNKEALKGLAQAQADSGRPNEALETLETAEAEDELISQFETDNRGGINNSNTFLYRDNTTDGDYAALVLEFDVSLSNLTRLGVAYTRGRMTQETNPDIIRDQFVLPMQRRFNDKVVINFSPGYQWNTFDPVVVPPSTEPADNFNLFVWDAYATVPASDWVRIDVGNSRQTLTIPETVFKHIDLVMTNVGLDWRLAPRVISFWEPSYTSYSDGNARFAFGERVEWTPPVRVPIEQRNYIVLSQILEYFNFKEELSNGYFNPSNYIQVLGGLRFVTDIGRRMNLNIAGALGTEKETGGDWSTTGSFEAELQIKISKNGYLRTGYVHSGSRLRSPDGFRAKGYFLSLDFYVPR